MNISYSADFCEKKTPSRTHEVSQKFKKKQGTFFSQSWCQKKQKKTHGKTDVFLEKIIPEELFWRAGIEGCRKQQCTTGSRTFVDGIPANDVRQGNLRSRESW